MKLMVFLSLGLFTVFRRWTGDMHVLRAV